MKNNNLSAVTKQYKLSELNKKQWMVVIFYVICQILVQLGSQKLAIVFVDFYEAKLMAYYEKSGKEITDKTKITHVVISFVLAMIIVFLASFCMGKAFGKLIKKYF